MLYQVILYVFQFSFLLTRLCYGFKVYWNVPTEKCQTYGINFNLSKYNIIQNSRDLFHGDRISIIYGPGRFPYFDGSDPVWGGIPQNANWTKHVEVFEEQVNKQIPLNFSGFLVLDSEFYQPIYDIAPPIYKNASREWVKKMAPNLPGEMLDIVAKATFEYWAKELFEIPLLVGKMLRPGAKWGYYHYPYCSNYDPKHPACKPKQLEANTHMAWLFENSGAIYPSIYIYKNGWDTYSRGSQVQERLEQALRLCRHTKTPVLAYFWFKFHDADEIYLDEMDLWSTLGLAWHKRLDGAIIWGSGNDVQSLDKCLKLKAYLKTTLGPMVKFITEF